MTKQQLFIANFIAYAYYVQYKTGLNADIVLTQAALETGWGERAIGNNFFGVKALPNTPIKDKQLFKTREVLKTAKSKFPQVISIKKLSSGLFEYVVMDWFRKYLTPAHSFADYANLFQRAPRYAKAWAVRNDSEKFFVEIHKAGYATAPNYSEVLIRINKTVKNLMAEFDKNF